MTTVNKRVAPLPQRQMPPNQSCHGHNILSTSTGNVSAMRRWGTLEVSFRRGSTTTKRQHYHPGRQASGKHEKRKRTGDGRATACLPITAVGAGIHSSFTPKRSSILANLRKLQKNDLLSGFSSTMAKIASRIAWRSAALVALLIAGNANAFGGFGLKHSAPRRRAERRTELLEAFLWR